MALIRAEQISGSVYSSITSSYIDPLFISASAAAAGFTGMGDVTSVIPSYIGSGQVTASVASTGNIFLINSGSFIPFKINNAGTVEISGSVNELFLIKNSIGTNLLIVSQSGIVIFSTQSTELQGFAPAGGIYFTSSSFFVGLD